MSLAFVAQTTPTFSASTSTVPTLTAPTGVAAGDLVLIVAVYKQISATFTDPTGWTKLGGFQTANGAAYGASTGDVAIRIYARVWQAGDTIPTLAALTGGSTTSASGNVVGAFTIAYRATSGVYDISAQVNAQSTSATTWV
jgi:hypothetical protein